MRRQHVVLEDSCLRKLIDTTRDLFVNLKTLRIRYHSRNFVQLLTTKTNLMMNRKEFLKRSIMAIGAGLPLMSVVQSCGSDDSSTPASDPDCLENGTNVSIGSNHGHELTVSRSDVEAGLERTYQIDGTSGHGHTVTIGEADFLELQQNQSVTVTSGEGNGHTHSVRVSCA